MTGIYRKFKDVPVGNYFEFTWSDSPLYVKDSKSKVRVYGSSETEVFRKTSALVVDFGSEIRPEWIAQPVINHAD